MFWADRIAKEIQNSRAPEARGRPLIVRDEKTLSGRVHIGSMRGVAVHGLVSEVLAEYGVKNEFRYELNDFDPFDTVPGYLDPEKFRAHLGKPLFAVPSPEPGCANYAEYYGAEFVGVHKKAGFFPAYYRTYADLYRAGKMDDLIRTALLRAGDIRRILKDVSGSEKDETWLPVSVVCEQCGKIMTTRAYDFDGETVGYSCAKRPDETAPCGHAGRVAPWRGAAKLFWKVDWAAKWKVVRVDVEGAGKDHSTKGGARDVANRVAKEIFDFEPPFDIPYEFFLAGGKKMSSSKGRGTSAKDIADLFPPEVLRLALIGKDINEQINFDAEGDSVPRWYDLHDELAAKARDGIADDHTRLFALTELPQNRAEITAPWQMRFRDLAFVAQMPHLSLADEAARAKGGPLSDDEEAKLEERAGYAKFWLATYAPPEFRYALQNVLPRVALTEPQRRALAELARFLETGEKSGEEIHARLHALKAEIPVAPKELFQALYRIFLDRDSGPKAGWFLSVLPREFVRRRLAEASV